MLLQLAIKGTQKTFLFPFRKLSEKEISKEINKEFVLDEPSSLVKRRLSEKAILKG